MKKLMIWTSIVTLMLMGCATQTQIEYRDREVIKYVNSIQRDTLINNIHDSIYVNTYTINDTIYQYKYKERIAYRDRIVVKTDTVKNDVVSVQYQEKTIVKNKIPKWCWFLLTINILVIAFFILKTYLKWQTRI